MKFVEGRPHLFPIVKELCIKFWQNRETANVGLDSSVGRAPTRQSGGRRFKSRSSQFSLFIQIYQVLSSYNVTEVDGFYICWRKWEKLGIIGKLTSLEMQQWWNHFYISNEWRVMPLWRFNFMTLVSGNIPCLYTVIIKKEKKNEL